MKNDKDNRKQEQKQKENRQILRALGLFSQLGLSMACCVLIGILAGKFLDNLCGTSPLLMIIFTFIGAAAAFKVMFDIVKDWK